MSICCTMIYVAHLHDALHLPGLIWIHKRLFANPEYVGLETHASAEELQNCIQRIVERLAPALSAIQVIIDATGATGPLTQHANLMLVHAVRYQNGATAITMRMPSRCILPWITYLVSVNRPCVHNLRENPRDSPFGIWAWMVQPHQETRFAVGAD